MYILCQYILSTSTNVLTQTHTVARYYSSPMPSTRLSTPLDFFVFLLLYKTMKQIIDISRRYKKILIVFSATLLLLVPILYLSRAWLRTTGVTWYANTFYQPAVTKQFDNNISYANKQLAALSIKVDEPSLSDGCSGLLYQGIRVSLYCSKSASSGKVYDNEQFVKNWQQNAQQLENNLLSKGWVQINNVDQNITQLLDPATYQPEIVYELKKGKVSCSVRIGFNKYNTNNRRVFVDESCYRPIQIFGGY